MGRKSCFYCQLVLLIVLISRNVADSSHEEGSETTTLNEFKFKGESTADFRQANLEYSAPECRENDSCFHADNNECIDNPNFCGNGTDVRCAYENTIKMTMCYCKDYNKKFDYRLKTCRIPCVSYPDNCENGICIMDTKSNNKFCKCFEWARGDKCEIIEECERKKVDCGDDPNVAKCALTFNGTVYCQCKDDHLTFDSVAKTCKNCSCDTGTKSCDFEDGKKVCTCRKGFYLDANGDKCVDCACGEGMSGCEIKDGKKVCNCSSGFYSAGDKCEACKCGIGGLDCETQDGKKICDCYEGYAQFGDKCELCECGHGTCTFDESGKKNCACEKDYLFSPEGYCAKKCSYFDCENGGTCTDICQCPEGTRGQFCEIVDWCTKNSCGYREENTCKYNRTTKKGYCTCKDANSVFEEEYQLCYKCRCGDHGKCFLADGQRLCKCDEGYVDYENECKKCNCGIHTISCSFKMFGEKFCLCEEKYAPIETTSFSGDRNTNYQCEKCDCGDHGRCSFNKHNKVCNCDKTYRDFKGTCKKCDCGANGYCDFDDNGQSLCFCDYGYAFDKLTGLCEICNCDPMRISGIEFNCTLKEGEKICDCGDGFKDLGGYCKDIDECLDNPCSFGAACINLPGTFRCECKKGFLEGESSKDPRKVTCKDIDECSTLKQPCSSTSTNCINTPGTYDCVCKDGYYPTSGTSGPYHNPKFVSCNYAPTQWRDASIAVGVFIAVAIIGVICYMNWNKCNSEM